MKKTTTLFVLARACISNMAAASPTNKALKGTSNITAASEGKDMADLSKIQSSQSTIIGIMIRKAAGLRFVLGASSRIASTSQMNTPVKL